MEKLEIEYEKAQDHIKNPRKGCLGIMDQYLLPHIKSTIEEDDSIKKIIDYPAFMIWTIWFLVSYIINIILKCCKRVN